MNNSPPGLLIPRRGNKLTRSIGRCLLAVLRWRIEGELHNAPKFVVVLAPHTSAWDFYTANATMLAIGFRSHWLIADAYTWWPLGIIIGWLGGIPVERSASHDLVSQMVKTFHENDKFMLSLFPEGTRKKVSNWKTGFWHIAVQSAVPIQLVSLDYEKRMTVFGPVVKPSDNIDTDMKQIQRFYRGARGKNQDHT